GAHGVERRLPGAQGRARLRRRHRGPHQRRHRGPGRRVLPRQAAGLRPGSAQAAQRAVHLHRCLAAVVGWFGFNAGSAVAADEIASLAMINTMVATAAGVVAWSLVEALAKGRPSALGAASGAIAGLVGITPAAGTVGPMGAIVIGLAAGAICVWGVNGLKRMLRVDDTAD